MTTDSRTFRDMICGVRRPFVIRWMALLILAMAARIARPQQSARPLPKFEDYAVNEVFNGVPRPPVLATSEQRLFRTRIREGVEKGWGVWINGEWTREQNRPGPNFAGHYIVIVWGCGAGCIRMVMADAKSGSVYNPPLSAGGLALPMLMFPDSAGKAPELEYRLNSRLMIVKATPHWDKPDAVSYAFYFLWQGDRWSLLRRVKIDD